jgi:hypothetical protein
MKRVSQVFFIYFFGQKQKKKFLFLFLVEREREKANPNESNQMQQGHSYEAKSCENHSTLVRIVVS